VASLVHMITANYVSNAVGSLLAGFLIVWLFFEGTLALCVMVAVFVIPLSLLLTGRRKKNLDLKEALRLLDFRRKKKIFKIFLMLFFVTGLSFGFRSGFIFPLFLSNNGFDIGTVGLLIGLQTSFAGLISYLFARKFELGKLILMSGILYTVILSLLGFSSSVIAGILVIAFGIVEGLRGIGLEGIVSKITSEESYGTDIGLLMMGRNIGATLSLAMSGFLISMWGFAAPFLMSASILAIFYVTSYLILKE